jgi:serine/threonine protein kinase
VYTAPEVVNQEHYSELADIYSVGVVLLELLQNSLFTAEKHKQGMVQVEAALNALPEAPFPDLVRTLLAIDPHARISARQALAHSIFEKFGMATELPERIVNMNLALPYEDAESNDDATGENDPPKNVVGKKTPAKNREHKKLQRRLQLIDKFLQELESEHPWTKIAAFKYSRQFEQIDDEIDDISSSQSLADCCVLAHRFFELELPDFEDLVDRDNGVFADWTLETYVDNEASIFMVMDYCLYPRALSLNFD